MNDALIGLKVGKENKNEKELTEVNNLKGKYSKEKLEKQ